MTMRSRMTFALVATLCVAAAGMTPSAQTADEKAPETFKVKFDSSVGRFVGEVVRGMDVVDKLYSGYGEAAQKQFMSIQSEGNAFLAKNFPKLDYVKKATIEK